MSDLNLLIELQEYDDKLRGIKDILEELEDDPRIKDIKKETILLDKRKEELDIEIDKIKEELLGLNRRLKDNYFNIESIDGKLYDGSITDIKQLDHMNDEQILLKKETEKLENETLIVMEKQDILKDELLIVERRLEELNVEIKKTRELNIEKIDDYNIKIEEWSKDRLSILDRLDELVLKEYKSISAFKPDFLAELRDGKCTGCSMMLPVYIVNKVDNEELVRCENCNRLLYKNKGLKED